MSRIEQALRHSANPPTQDAAGAVPLTTLDAFPAVRPEGSRSLASVAAPQMELSDELIVNEQSPRICTEQFRALAAALHQKQGERGLKTLMITSAHANEGKTFTAANLGLMLSESYRRRVLVIDADLRRPSLHQVFNVANTDGLSDSLKEHSQRAATATEISEWLAILPGGTPEIDPMPILSSGRLQPIIQEAASRFDWVILDTPPIALLPDGPLMGSMVDAAVLVVGAGATPYRLVERAVQTLGRNKIVGVVLNRVDPRTLPEGSYDYYYGRERKMAARRSRFFGWRYAPAKQ